MLLATYIAYNKILRMFVIIPNIQIQENEIKKRSTTVMKKNAIFLNAHLCNFCKKLACRLADSWESKALFTALNYFLIKEML